MKVLIISNLYPPFEIGGYELAAFDVRNALVKEGIETFVLTKRECNLQTKSPEKGIFRKLILDEFYGDRKKNKSAKAQENINFTETLKIIQKIKPEIVYCWNQNFLGGGPINAAFQLRIPIVHHLMGFDLLKYFLSPNHPLKNLKKIIKNILTKNEKKYFITSKQANNVIFISHFLKEYFFRQQNFSPQNSSVIYPGLNIKKIKQKTKYILGNEINIVFIGRLGPHKGIDLILLALNKLNNIYPVNLVLYGDGEKNYVDHIRRNANCKIFLKGWQSREIIYEEIWRYDFGIFPSVWNEPFGISQIEMMAAGLPVFSSGAGGSCESLKDKKSGLIFKKGDHEDLLHKLYSFIKNYEIQAPFLSSNARKTILDRFSIETSSKLIVDFLNRIKFND